MKMQMKLGALLVAGAWVITGCGGGGGGGGGGAPSTVQINGTAAKGILIGADVRVYGLSAGKKSEKPLATAKTGPDGRYTLDIAPTTEPVLIEVEVNDTTTMLDETKALVGGQFPPVAAPKGLVLRSFAADASKLTVVRVNPLTEMAVAVAESTGQLSLNSLIAGQDMAILASPDGVNPFAQEPVAKPADMDENQLKFAMFKAGLLSSMTAICGLQCRIDELSKGVSISLGADGKASYTEQVERAIHERKAAVLTAGANLKVDTDKQAAVTSLSQSVIAAANNAAVNASGGTTRDPSVVIAANGLQGFVDAMREGFRVTEDRLLKVEKELDERYKDVTLEGTSYIGNVLDEIDMACTKVNQNLSCTSGATRGFTWTRVSENTFNWASTSPNDGRTSTGTVMGSVKNGLDTLSVNGSIVKDGQELVTMTGIEFGFQEKGDAEFHTKINGTLQAKDDKGLVVTLKFDNVDMKSVPRASNTALADMTFKGGLTLEANNGDKLTGAIDLTMVEVTRQINNGYQVNDSFVTLGRINLKAVTATTNVLALDVSFTTSLPDYTQDVTKQNYETSDGTLKLALTDSLFLTFNEKSTTYDKVSQVATIKSGTSEVQLTAEYKATTQGSTGWCRQKNIGWESINRCASQINLKTTNANPYTATLTKGTNGKTQGDIFLGSTKVGEFVNGVLKINGSEVSIY
jgi:hypothetical protein